MHNSVNNNNHFFSKDKDEDNDEERIMHSKCDNIEIMINNKTDEVSGKRYVSFRNRHENDLETLTKSFPIVFDYLHHCIINPIK